MRLYRSQKLMRPDLQAHIYSQALLGNLNKLKSLCPASTKMCAVVKANAYGHGIMEIVNILKKTDIDFFAVASIYEAMHIMDLCKKQSVLILEPLSPLTGLAHVFLSAKKGFHCVISCSDTTSIRPPNSLKYTFIMSVLFGLNMKIAYLCYK